MNLHPLSITERLYKSIKWLVLFGLALAYFKPHAGDEAPGVALGFLVCLPLYIAIYRVLYGEIEELFEGIGYVFTPDFLSLLFRQWLDDFFKSAKVFIWLGLCFMSGATTNSYYARAYERTRQEPLAYLIDPPGGNHLRTRGEFFDAH